jgi:hypothetical protein
MKVKFETVKNTVFGEFLGCAFQDLLRQTLQNTPEKAGELNCEELDISVSLNGTDLDFQRLFSSFEGNLSVASSNSPEGETITVSREALQDILNHIRSASDECTSVASQVEESFSDAISAAGNAVSEYAAEAARDAGYEHSPGGECTDEILGHSQTAADNLESLLNEARQREAA